MSAYLSPIGNEQEADSNGAPVSGALINTYLAGTTTPVTTYTDAAGLVPQANPIACNSAGRPASPIFLPAGQAVKMVFTTSLASGSVAYRPAVDNIQGVNDPSFSTTVSEWTAFSGTPTFISATSFSVTGDQTNTFQLLRRIRSSNTGGTIYSTVTAAAFSAGITTVTVTNSAGVLDSGLSSVSYGLLSVTNPSIPETAVGKALRVAASVTAARTAIAADSTVQTFTANGTYTAPAGLRFAIVEVQGPGGGGAGAASGDRGNGGGGGGYARKLILASTIGATQAVTVPAGGAGGAAGANAGTNGTTASFGALLTAGGGQGGVTGGSTSAAIGGIGTLGDVNVRGGSGVLEGSGNVSGGGGGSVLGGGGQAVAASAGIAGGNYGGGGSGGQGAGATARAGGAGAPGIVIVTEFY